MKIHSQPFNNELEYIIYLKDLVEKIEMMAQLLKIPTIVACQVSSEKTIYSFIPISNITDKRFYCVQNVLDNGDLGFVTISSKSKLQYEKLQRNTHTLLTDMLDELISHDKSDTCNISFSILRSKIENFLKDNTLSILE